MKINLLQILVVSYLLLVFLLTKTFSIIPIVFLIIAFAIDYLTGIRSGIKNLMYILAAFSAFLPLLSIFLLYIPFAVFGLLLSERSFTKNYILGFAVSFIPSTVIYLISTYLSIPLALPAIIAIFYLLPLIAMLVLRKKLTDAFEIDSRESAFFLIVLFFTTIIAISIVDNRHLFIANGVREFSRLQPIIEGLNSEGLIPIYNPGTGQGEATYLWVPPTYSAHFGLSNFLLGFIPPIMFFNVQTFFILLLSTLSLGVLFESIINKSKYSVNMLAVAAVAVAIGLNFFFLQFLESIKQFYSYSTSYLLLSIIISNPRKFNDYAILMYISSIILTIHSAYGFGVLVVAGCLFLLTKSYYLKDQSEIKSFFKWIANNKLKFFTAFAIIMALPLFYVQSSVIYSDFLYQQPQIGVTYSNIKADVTNFFEGFIKGDLKILSLRYPDVNRIDDHKIGAFISIFGVLSFILLIFAYKIKEAKNFRTFAFAYILNLIILSFLTSNLGVRLGGLFRTNQPYLLILLGASMLTFICLLKKNYIKYILIAVVFIAVIHTIPYARQNLANIHQELFASGEVYTNEIDFIKKLPIDGRIITYGLFANAIDFGSNQLTGRYFSRDEREELASFDRNIYAKIHGQYSWGDPNLPLNKSGIELSNYLRLGGYKYIFTNVCHPIGNFVATSIYPVFTYPVYQNNCFVLLAVNSTSYAEEVDLANDVSDETYRKKDGYKYVTISKYYGFENFNADLKENPREPKPLKFERMSAAKVRIIGDFGDNGWVLFKERYWPRWKAYMEGREVPVIASNHESILIKTIKGSSITLEYAILPKEKIFGTVSLIGFLALIVFLLILLHEAVKEKTNGPS